MTETINEKATLKEIIEENLSIIGEDVYYGAGIFGDRNKWDCIVFGRRSIEKKERTKTHIYFVAIVKEEYITESLIDSVIKQMQASGMKQRSNSASFEYLWKSGECMVEICVMEFYKSRKEC